MEEYNDMNLPADFDDLSKHAPLLDALRGKGDGLSSEAFVQGGFVVPESYFGETGELIASKTSLPSSDGFIVPENYFEELAERIVAGCRLSVVGNQPGADQLTTDNRLPFSLPENYFEQFTDTLQTKIALDNIKEDAGFDVPENYFDKLANRMMTRVSAEELKTGSDADVPEGYFDLLADRITARIAEEGTTKQEQKERGRVIVFAEVLKRYALPAALAASAALLIAVSTWFLNRETPVDKAPLAKNNTPKQQPELGHVVQQPVQPQQEKERLLNPAPAPVVKVKKQDVLEQIDLIDETTVAEYVNDQSPASEVKPEEFLNDEMYQYLLDDNANPAELFTEDINKEK